MNVKYLLVGLLLPLSLAGCLIRSKGGAESAPKHSAVGDLSTLSLCEEGLIEDGEDGDSQIIVEGGRDGYWYTDAEGESTVQPPKGEDKYEMKAGGADGTALTAWMTGTAKGKDPAVTLGMELTEKGAYDASRYAGVRFFARGKGEIHFSILDVNTAEKGGRCKATGDTDECYNGHGVKFQLTPEWKEYRFTWDQLEQEPDWGFKAKFEPNAIYNMQWQGHEGTVELYLDQLAFMGCPAGTRPLTKTAAPAKAPPAAAPAEAPSASAAPSAAPAPAASAAPKGK